MRMNQIAEATLLWLPGFEPEGYTGPVATPEVLHQPATGWSKIGLTRAPVAARPPKAVWPMLEAATLDVGGQVSKFAANIAAIKTLKAIETEGRTPTADEAITLTRFTGWGGMPQAFKQHFSAYSETDKAWEPRAKELRELLTEDELKAAEDATPNSHYTSHEVITAMWKAVQGMGFKGGRILEPSCGAGYFIGAMPTSVAQESQVTAVELDSITARIAKALYGHYGVKVIESGLEKTQMPDGFFDLVISNVPFGNYEVADAKGRWPGVSIHNYFILRALEMTRVGGLVAVITSAFTMDAWKNEHRLEMAKLGELVTAIRLPNGAFSGIANTDVMTDVLIFVRREQPSAGAWINRPESLSSEQKVYAHEDIRVNPYYAAHPAQAIGKFKMVSGARGRVVGLAHEGDLTGALDALVTNLPEVFVSAHRESEMEVSPRDIIVASDKWVKPGAYVITEDDRLARSLDGLKLEVVTDASVAKATRIRAMIPVRDAVRRLLAVQAATEDEDVLERYRVALGCSYQAFVAKFGPISKKFNCSAYRDDPDFPLLLSLEHWDEEEQVATKADVFYRRTVGATRRVERCETPEDALLVCLSEYARIVPARIAELLTEDEDVAMGKLVDAGRVYRDPMAKGRWEEASAYLSGDVKTKLLAATLSAEDDDEYARNVAALEQVIPADIPAHDIAAKIGAGWVPVDVYDAFAKRLAGNSVTVARHTTANTWSVRGYCGAEATQKYGTARAAPTTLLELALNQQAARITDLDPTDPERKRRVVNVTETVAANEVLARIKDEFVRWLWEDEPQAARLSKLYNDTFNRTVVRQYDGAHLTLPGFGTSYTLRPHQRNAIWRSVASAGNTLLAHVVGAGKTLVMICAAMEMRRTGSASKPVIVVPNHMLEQFAGDFLRAYPAANILVASKDDMTPERRKALLARMAMGDWDAVVMTHSSFERVPAPAKYLAKVVDDNLAMAEAVYAAAKQERSDTRAIKEMAKRRKVWKARLETKVAAKNEDFLDFAEVGFDALLVDEFHYFKNLYRFSTMRMSGLPTSDSQRSFDMDVKVGYIGHKRGDGRGVIAATGTPIANSIAEMWVMQHYLQPQTLRRYGMELFDAWAANFGEAVQAMELSPDGSSYRVHTRFARFVNVPELLTMFREVADIQTADMLDLPVPKAVHETITAKPSAALKDYVAGLVARAEAIRNKEVTPQEDNMLAITGDGRKAATDARLVGIEEDDPGSKVNLLVQRVAETWRGTAEAKGTQLVFLDQGTPNGKGWSLYADIRGKLVETGIPVEEIAFVHEASTDKAKEALFKSVRNGAVRVLIGSTSKMGVGTNVQTRLVALHHVDGPWRPADVEQREGRIIRQGNLNAVARLIRYVTEGTFDAYVWQTLETKARFIGQVMRGDAGLRSIEDAELAALSYAEVKALASGNPLIIEKAGVDAEVMRLSMLKSAWYKRQEGNRTTVALLPGYIERGVARVAAITADLAASETVLSNLTLDVSGKVIEDAEEIGKRVLALAYMAQPGQYRIVGNLGGFTLKVRGALSLMHGPELHIEGGASYRIDEAGKTARGIVGQIKGVFSHGIAGELAAAEHRLARDRDSLEGLRKALAMPFEQEQRLSELIVRKTEIDAELMPSQAEVVDVSGDAELAQAA